MAVQELYADCVNDHSLGLYKDERPEQQTIVPVKTLQLVEKVLKSKSLKGVSINLAVGSVKMAASKETVTFQCGDVTIFSRLVDGRFPKWRSIIPKMDNALRAVVRSGELLSAIIDEKQGKQYVYLTWQCKSGTRKLPPRKSWYDYIVTPIDDQDGTGYKVKEEHVPEIPIDEDCYVTQPDEYENGITDFFDTAVIYQAVDMADGTKYTLERPRFVPAESLFRTRGTSDDGRLACVEWKCEPGTRKLQAVTLVNGYVKPGWEKPNRIIPMEQFLDEMIERGGLFTGKAEDH